jgi:pyridoxal phosphate enzyme (YggS family)
MPENVDIATRLQQVVVRVRSAEKRFGRQSGCVQILPVSKTRPPEDITQVAQAGFSAFGESYLQEAQEKITALAKTGLHWHFIGPIQSNKTQTIATLFHWVHSVDREKIARRLNDQRPKNLPPLNICLQVNISGEKSKSGIRPSALSELASAIIELPRLRLRGLMAIPAPSTDFEKQREAFKAVHEIFDSLKMELGDAGEAMDTLSMGMSNDLEAAIAEGSTMVRIGTDIFGPRNISAGHTFIE